MGGDRGWKTLTEASDKPRKSAGKLQKKVQVSGSDLFAVQVADFGQKCATSRPSRSFWADKYDLQIWVSRRQISEKVVVSAATDVCHLRNKARNTQKLKILMFEGFRGEKHHKNRKNRKLKRNPSV